MDTLKVYLQNCYGISLLDESFDFSRLDMKDKPIAQAYAIYAPNGLMKTSFAKTFDALSRGEKPKEERFGRESICIVEVDNYEIKKDQIYVLRSEIDIRSENEAVTNILVNKEKKERYDILVSEIDRLKLKLIASLQKKSKIKKDEIEALLKKDFEADDFITAVGMARNFFVAENLDRYVYGEIFDPKAISLLNSPEFLAKSDEFNIRYQELFDKAGTIYTRGVFNPAKADASFDTLHKQGYFAGGHRVHLRGDPNSIDYTELQEKIRIVNNSIDSDGELKRLREGLAKNAQTQALNTLFENLSAAEVDFLLNCTKPLNQQEFKRKLWAFYVQSIPDASALLDEFNANKDELHKNELEAAKEAPGWFEAIELFNDRFVDMPFTLSLFNQAEASLGKAKAKLKFIFKDGGDQVECAIDEIKSLSQGEKRALYILNFIFEVEDRRKRSIETLFVIDDVADSFDYKNKHAIVQYLEDISKVDFFSQLILTHNFDFFRSLSNNFVHRKRCLMANRIKHGLKLSQAEGVENYFIGMWKNKINSSDIILCATVPFTRNLIEYIKGKSDPVYLKLTSLLHWKEETVRISVGDYYDIYNNLFGTNHPTTDKRCFYELLFDKANEIRNKDNHDGLNLEDKVVLSIAIRMKSEIFLIEEIRKIKSDEGYWCEKESQFGALMKLYTKEMPLSGAIKILEKVSVTVSSNIHLNSFMYEPILDLTIEHLIKLYSEVLGLESAVPAPQETESAL